jgi:hypothetical protein
MKRFTISLLLSAVFALPAVAQLSPEDAGVPLAAETQFAGKDVVSAPEHPLVQNSSQYQRPTASQRRKNYINSMVGPLALGKYVVWAGIGTWRNSPEEWGDQWEGFGRRVASNFGKNIIKQTTMYGLDEALKVDSKFYRSQKKDAGSKVKNALISPFTARTPSGKRVPGIPRIAATYTSSIVAAEAWFPARYSWKDGVKNGTYSLAFNAGFNLVKEFIWKK